MPIKRSRGVFRRRVVVAGVILSIAAVAADSGVAHPQAADAARPRRFAEGSMPPPRFMDPARMEKLRQAFPEVDRILTGFAERRHMPGFAFGIIVDGEVAFVDAHGVRNIETKSPTDPDTVFRIASMTKSFTAMAVVKLRDEGRLSLDDPVARWIPELADLAYPTRDAPVITIRDLLTHAAGLPEDNPWGDRQLAASDATISGWMREGLPFSNVPGVAYEYSNFGFAMLGQVVARVSGMRYRDYVDTNILRPLGMASTFWEASAVPPDRLATGYRWENGRWVAEVPLADGAFGAMGGLFTSTRDLARYVGFMMSAWPPRDAPETGPVRRASLREMQQAWRMIPAQATRERVDLPMRLSAGGYGYGLLVTQDCRFGHAVSHGGGLPGFGSTMRWLPDYGVGLIALGNVTYAGFSQGMREAVAALARTGGLQPRRIEPSPVLARAREAVTRLIQHWDDTLAHEIAADNLFLDRAATVRRAELDELADRHGTCRSDGPIEAENALRGVWTMPCDRGALHVAVTLAPTAPPRVQSLAIRSAMPPSPQVVALWSRVLDLANRWDAAVAARLASPETDVTSWRSQLETVAAGWGACRPGQEYSGDGMTTSVTRVSCDRGELLGSMQIDDEGRITSLSLEPAPEAACVP